MEKIFVDTSALFSLANTSEATHDIAWETMKTFAERNYRLAANNYVVVETFALIQSRLGIEIARQFNTNVMPNLQIAWIDEEQHRAIVERLFSANRRQLSLVDCSSFETMRQLGIEQVFTFDEHFREQGFTVIP
ncbi:MAG: PIN domain-containing protein [Anaerolineaceae bacterium]|jgi:predicted nucleic acid-binding protein|nr:MAG: PIN domain-containing protein [Anaerolineaceae bacterium]